MQSLFFGPPDKQLFGVYYQPQRQPARDCGVVLCNPLAPELGHTCKCFHHLALLLAQAGFAAFRFDYFGTGDSAGSGEEGSVRQWMEDIRCATDELRRQGCRRFCLAGLRFGATLAARFATERDAVDSLVLWEPWVSGQDCLADLQRLHELAFTAAGFGCPRTEEEMVGQPFPNRLREEIRALHLRGSFDNRGRRVLLIEDASGRSASLGPDLERSGCSFDRETTNLPPFWEDNLGLAFVPRPLLERIVTWVSEVSISGGRR